MQRTDRPTGPGPRTPSPPAPRWYMLFSDDLSERDYRNDPLDLGIDVDIQLERDEAFS